MSVVVTVVAPAPPEVVWERWTGFADWPDWNPHCLTATLDGPLAPGSRLDLHLRDPKGRDFYTRPRITEAESGARLTWVASGLLLRARTTTILTGEHDGTRVSIESDATGPLAFTYRIAVSERVQALMYVGMLDALNDVLRS